MIEQIVIDHKRHKYNSAKDVVEKLNYFRKLSKNGLHNLNDQELKHLKSEYIRFQNVILTLSADTYPSKIFRVTNNKYLYNGQKVKLQKVTDLIGPPAGKSNYGRCNQKGESVFYASLDFKTAIWETRPQAGDYITVSEWKVKPGERLNTHFIFHPSLIAVNKESSNAYKAWIESKKQINPEIAEVFDELIFFLTEQFTKKVKDNENLNYLFSANYSSRLIQQKPDINGFKIDAVCYPSVRVEYGLTNLAIVNDCVFDKLQLNKITVYEICETNYDTTNVLTDDLIKVSPMIISTDKFDLDNNKINYNLDAELNLAIELHEKYNNS
ncbi:RES family NAD+ phosphorylase [Aquirufa ecclesiirivi]